MAGAPPACHRMFAAISAGPAQTVPGTRRWPATVTGHGAPLTAHRSLLTAHRSLLRPAATYTFQWNQSRMTAGQGFC